MAEWLIAAVLKTAEGDEPSVGSNPSLSAKQKREFPKNCRFLFNKLKDQPGYATPLPGLTILA
jgi:hypothetical protein